MDYVKRSSRISKLEREGNYEIRDRVSASETVVDKINRKWLKWFGPLLRLLEEERPKEYLGKKKRGRLE